MTGPFRILLLLLAACVIGLPQQGLPQPKSAANDIFSGTVAELTSDSLIVVRKAPAKPDVMRKFVRDDQTKVEGALKVAARVTVSFKADEEGQLHALHIIVRQR